MPITFKFYTGVCIHNANAYEVLSDSHHMPITFKIFTQVVCIHNANAYEVLSDSHHYFTFVGHICSFILPCLALILVFVNAHIVFTDTDKYFTVGSLVFSFKSVITYVFFDICFFSFMPIT